MFEINKMIILGIETSCDESAAAVVENGCIVHSNIIASQISIHEKTGGIVPEVAAREHVSAIIPVIDDAVKKAAVSFKKINAIGVTIGPGLIGSLLTGTTAASTLGAIYDFPVIGVNHIKGHLYSNWLEREDISFPVMVLTVSGGHNELVLIRDFEDFQAVGETLDDAAGEAFDKVARILGLGYPGGPAIAKAALKGNSGGFSLPKKIMEGSYDFSFSGLKTAVMYLVRETKKIDENFVYDVAAAFQESVCTILSDKLVKAALEYQVKEIHLAGGVSANLRLREKIAKVILDKKIDCTFRYPKNFSYCTDNAAMIAAAAYFQYRKNPAEYQTWQNVTANLRAGF